MVRRAFEEASVAELAGEATVCGYGFSADEDASGAAFDRLAFVGAVVDVHVVGAGRYFAAVFGIPNHDVGVGSDADSALAGKETEDLGRFGAGAIDEAVNVEFAGADAFRPQHGDAIFE